jgi:hypothetical protein
MAKRIYMRQHPDFQLRSAKFPMPEIMIGGYASLSCPTLDGLRMKAPEDSGSGCAIEKRFNCLKCPSGYAGRVIKSISKRCLSLITEPLTDSCFDLCI